MQLKPEEISKVIRSQIKYYENTIQRNETGTILMVGDGIARASGLTDCMAGELLEIAGPKAPWYWQQYRVPAQGADPSLSEPLDADEIARLLDDTPLRAQLRGWGVDSGR